MHYTIGIIGFGSFGRFMASHLLPYANIIAYDPKASATGLESVTLLQEVDGLSQAQVIIFAVPLSGLPAACEQVKNHLRPDALVIDVTSVKEAPLAILKEHFPNHALLGTHPIFGPVSGKDGIAGMRIVVCDESCDETKKEKAIAFLRNQLLLEVIEMTAREHDEEIACVQGLTHFIGRALSAMNIPDSKIATRSYQHLQDLVALLKQDSFELFKTIENGNPYTKEVREEFVTTLKGLEDSLKN
jgi:prephenate dehydrogenase